MGQKLVVKAQKQQKVQHDKAVKNSNFLGSSVCVHDSNEDRAATQDIKGPYRVTIHPNGSEIHPIGKPRAGAIRLIGCDDAPRRFNKMIYHLILE